MNLKRCLSSAQIFNAATPPIYPIFIGVPLQFILFGPAELRSFIKYHAGMSLSYHLNVQEFIPCSPHVLGSDFVGFPRRTAREG